MKKLKFKKGFPILISSILLTTALPLQNGKAVVKNLTISKSSLKVQSINKTSSNNIFAPTIIQSRMVNDKYPQMTTPTVKAISHNNY